MTGQPRLPIGRKWVTVGRPAALKVWEGFAGPLVAAKLEMERCFVGRFSAFRAPIEKAQNCLERLSS
jgi:hypothetical protein